MLRVTGWCGYTWEMVKVHCCGRRGEHTHHECADDGCTARELVALKGERFVRRTDNRSVRAR